MGYNNLGLLDMTQGDPAVRNNWGNLTNVNLNIISQAVSGITALSVAGSANVVLTSAQGSVEEDPAAFFNISGTLTGDVIVLWPATVTRVFSAVNNTTGAFSLELGVSNGSGGAAGTTATLPQGTNGFFVSDGTNVTLIGLSLNDPTFTGTVTMPDGSTWSSSGLTLNDAATFTGQTVTGGAFTGGTWDDGAIGGGTPAAGSFTTLAASGALYGDGFIAFMASPPPIGTTAADVGEFTTLVAQTSMGSYGQVETGAALANQLTVNGSVTTDPVTITATGSDTNIGINLVPKGTGVVSISGTPLAISPFSAKFISSAQVVPSAGSVLQVAHGLGARPFKCFAVLQNVTAEHGYNPGDQVELDSAPSQSYPTPDDALGQMIKRDATNIYFIAAAAGVGIYDYSNFGNVAITTAKWEIFLCAWV